MIHSGHECRAGFMSEEGLITRSRVASLCEHDCHAQAVLGSVLLHEPITGRWLVGACCLLAGQGLIVRATKGSAGQTAPTEIAKAE